MRLAWPLVGAVGCCPGPGASVPGGSGSPRPPVAEVYAPPPTDSASSRQVGNPLSLADDDPARDDAELLAKLRSSPHRYFRAVNTSFAREVCRRFDAASATLPTVNLHGDAHLEQVAVTATGAGLSDFDDSVSGPPVIDLVRFGTSVALAAEQHGWASERAVESFLDAYEASLDGTENELFPAALGRLRAAYAGTRDDFLTRADALMATPVPAHKEMESKASWTRYVALMQQINPSIEPDFFQVKRKGEPAGFGVGSATSKRVLYRIEGATPAAGDDVILEAKEMRDVAGIPCVEGRGGLSVRVLLSATRFGVEQDPFLAVVPRDPSEALDDPPWWVQSWWASYAEIDIRTSLESEGEMQDVVAFAAGQLARGHVAYLPAPYDVQLRTLLGNMMAEHRQSIVSTVRDLASDVRAAHAEL